jgi:ketosteroid isomerase-like protein
MTGLKLDDVYGAIDARDWSALADLLDDEVVYDRPGYDSLVGRDQVLHYYREVRVIASGRHELQGAVEDGDRAACWGRMRGTLRDGSAADVEFADVFTFANGRIRTRRSYFYTPLV